MWKLPPFDHGDLEMKCRTEICSAVIFITSRCEFRTTRRSHGDVIYSKNVTVTSYPPHYHAGEIPSVVISRQAYCLHMASGDKCPVRTRHGLPPGTTPVTVSVLPSHCDHVSTSQIHVSSCRSSNTYDWHVAPMWIRQCYVIKHVARENIPLTKV